MEYFTNEIKCKSCQVLLGYAPYWRTDYLCLKCNGAAETDENEKDNNEQGD